MKLKALASLCSEAKTLALFDAADGSQWAGTDAALWKLPENLGRLTTDALCAIFDISAEKAAKMDIRHEQLPGVLDTDDQSPNERKLLYWLGRRLILDGDDMLPTKAPDGEIFCLKTRWLKPGSDAEQPGLSLRHTADEIPYIVHKDGLFVTGILYPRAPEPEQVTWLADVCRGITV